MLGVFLVVLIVVFLMVLIVVHSLAPLAQPLVRRVLWARLLLLHGCSAVLACVGLRCACPFAGRPACYGRKDSKSLQRHEKQRCEEGTSKQLGRGGSAKRVCCHKQLPDKGQSLQDLQGSEDDAVSSWLYQQRWVSLQHAGNGEGDGAAENEQELATRQPLGLRSAICQRVQGKEGNPHSKVECSGNDIRRPAATRASLLQP